MTVTVVGSLDDVPPPAAGLVLVTAPVAAAPDSAVPAASAGDALDLTTTVAARVTAATAEVKARRRAAPQSLAGADPDDVRRLAAAAMRAVADGRTARAAAEKLGPRPDIDAAVESAALDAEAFAGRAATERRAVAGRAPWVMFVANAGGAAVVGLRLLAPVTEPLVPLIALLPLTGLGLSAAAASRSRRRSGRAAAALAAALGAAGAPDVEALAARRATLDDWTRRADAAAAAERAAGRVLGRWAALVGPGRPPQDVEELLGAEAALHAAEDELRAARAALLDTFAPLVVAGAPDEAALARLVEAAASRQVVVVTDDARLRAWAKSARAAA